MKRNPNFFLIFLIMMLYGASQSAQAQCADCVNIPPAYDECTPPTGGYDRVVTVTGNQTWTSLLAGISHEDMKQRIRIIGTGTLRVVNGNLKMSDANSLIVVEGPELIINNGNLIFEKGSVGTFRNVRLRTSGNIQQSEGSTLCITNSEVEVGDEQAGGRFNTTGNQYTSANFQNDKGRRYLNTVCMNVTHDYQLQSGGGEDILINVCAEIGDQGGTHARTGVLDGQDSGNFQNSSNMRIYNSRFWVIENVQNQSSGTLLTCDVSFRTTNGNFQNDGGNLSGCDLCVWVDNQHLMQNDGNWTATFEKRRANTQGSYPNLPANSSAADIASCFIICCEGGNPFGSIGNFVWNDLDRDGIQDVGEPGVPNVTVQLKNCNNTVLSTTTTNANGLYNFPNLQPGCYRVGVVLPTGFQATLVNQGTNDAVDNDIIPATSMTGDIQLGISQNDPTNDIGIFQAPTGRIGDQVFCDNNNNGVFDTGDTPIANVTVTLCNASNVVIATTTTNASGIYSFNNLVAATYFVKFPTTADNKPLSTPNNLQINLGAGQTILTADAGYFQPPVNIGDFVWKDTDGDGLQDVGEIGIPNVTVKLQNPAGTTLQTTTTQANGRYNFRVQPGLYKVMFNTPADCDPSPQTGTPSTFNNTDNDNNPITGMTDVFTVNPNQPNPTIDAGFKPKPLGSIGDFTFCDNNNNGVFDTGDKAEPNVLVTLCNASNVVIATATTDAQGKYLFTNLAAATYIVKFPSTVTGGKTITTPNPITVPLAVGQNFLDADGGYKPLLGSIGDFTFCDNNNNGVFDTGDKAEPNVQVTLCNASNVVIATATTDAQGKYLFTNLAAATYIVKFPSTVSGGKTITTPNPITVPLAAGQNFLDADGGYKPPVPQTGSIGDYVFCDNNSNGIQDAGDTPQSSVVVQLRNASSVTIATATTDAQGKYLFTNLAAGTYIVRFPNTTSDGKPITTPTHITVNLSPGQSFLNADAGYKPVVVPTCPDGSPKKTPGTACTDNNPNTHNDVIQADGCTCRGTTTPPPCDQPRNNAISKACVNGLPTLTGTALAGYEYMWLKSTSACPSDPSQAIPGATGQNYTLPSAVSQTTYFSRCARPIGCTQWGAITESNCVSVTPSDCTGPGGDCSKVSIVGNTNGTITVSGLGSYKSQIQVFNSLWQSVSTGTYSQSSVTIPVKAGTYTVKVQLYTVTNTGWKFICETTAKVTVTGISISPLVGKEILLELTAYTEIRRSRLSWVNNSGDNTDFFSVQKLDNTTGLFEEMEVLNANPSDKLEYYTTYDNEPTEGDNIYRVVAKFNDGTSKASDQSTVRFQDLYDIRLFPNPASDYMNLDLNQYRGNEVTIHLYNALGKEVLSQNVNKVNGQLIQLDIEEQITGMYLIRVTSKGKRDVLKKVNITK